MEDKFVHSVKVPNQYRKAAKLLKKTFESGESVKGQIFQEKHVRTNRLYALIVKISKNKSKLDVLIERSSILQNEPRLDKYLCLVLMTELLFGPQKLNGESKPVLCILRYESKFREILNDLNNTDLVHNTEQLKEVVKPRYVRVNTNILSRADAIELFVKDGWNEIVQQFTDYDKFLEVVRNLGDYDFVSDMHVKNLFVFPASSKRYWAKHPLVSEKKVILQDKASCLPTVLLDPPKGSVILDMCAAPGMKTTHLAAMIRNKGKIYAVERNESRYVTLTEFVVGTLSTCVKPMQIDALTLEDRYVPNVEYILVDPSCSGTGMTNRLFVSTEKDTDRLANLTGLQSRMLTHAMRAFTKASKIVYSTCSIHHEENEKVVQECLEMCPDWELIKPIAFAEQWKHFGSPKYKHIGKKCIYAKSEIDLTDGFFVAIFERKVDSTKEEEPYDPNKAFLERIEWNLRPKFLSQTTADFDHKEPVQDLDTEAKASIELEKISTKDDLTTANGKNGTTLNELEIDGKPSSDSADVENTIDVTLNETKKKKKRKTKEPEADEISKVKIKKEKPDTDFEDVTLNETKKTKKRKTEEPEADEISKVKIKKEKSDTDIEKVTLNETKKKKKRKTEEPEAVETLKVKIEKEKPETDFEDVRLNETKKRKNRKTEEPEADETLKVKIEKEKPDTDFEDVRLNETKKKKKRKTEEPEAVETLKVKIEKEKPDTDFEDVRLNETKKRKNRKSEEPEVNETLKVKSEKETPDTDFEDVRLNETKKRKNRKTEEPEADETLKVKSEKETPDTNFEDVRLNETKKRKNRKTEEPEADETLKVKSEKEKPDTDFEDVTLNETKKRKNRKTEEPEADETLKVKIKKEKSDTDFEDVTVNETKKKKKRKTEEPEADETLNVKIKKEKSKNDFEEVNVPENIASEDSNTKEKKKKRKISDKCIKLEVPVDEDFTVYKANGKIKIKKRASDDEKVVEDLNLVKVEKIKSEIKPDTISSVETNNLTTHSTKSIDVKPTKKKKIKKSKE